MRLATQPVTALAIGMHAEPHRGGLDRYYNELAHALPPHGVMVRRVLGGSEGPLHQRAMRVRRRIARCLNDSDLIVSHFAPYAFGAIDYLRRAPLVVHFHGPWAAEGALEGDGAGRAALKAILERAVYRRGARVIALSEAFAAIVARTYAVPFDAIRVVSGGIDHGRYAVTVSRETARRALGLPVDRPIIAAVRRLVRAKGIEPLIDAIDVVHRRYDDVLCAIAGRGPLDEQLRRRVAERGLQRHVRLMGFVPDQALPAFYRAADVVAVPTVALEGFGLVVLESLASGTPVLVSPVAGLPETVAGLDPSLAFAEATPRAFASLIDDVLSGRKRLPSPSACTAYAKGFDWPIIARKVADVYREAV